jgi:hypothetical protein
VQWPVISPGTSPAGNMQAIPADISSARLQINTGSIGIKDYFLFYYIPANYSSLFDTKLSFGGQKRKIPTHIFVNPESFEHLYEQNESFLLLFRK